MWIRPALLLCLLLASCAPPSGPPVVPPVLPAHVYGERKDNDRGALAQAQWAFTDPDNTRGNPVAAALAVVAVEYLADDLRTNPPWFWPSAGTVDRMVQARVDLRRVLGMRPDAPPQAVVDAMLTTVAALRRNEPGVAREALRGDAFTLGPDETLRRLGSLPFLPSVNAAANLAYSSQWYPGDLGGSRMD